MFNFLFLTFLLFLFSFTYAVSAPICEETAEETFVLALCASLWLEIERCWFLSNLNLIIRKILQLSGKLFPLAWNWLKYSASTWPTKLAFLIKCIFYESTLTWFIRNICEMKQSWDVGVCVSVNSSCAYMLLGELIYSFPCNYTVTWSVYQNTP